MMKKFNFSELFIYDLANNHQGDLQHGLKVVNAIGKETREASVRAAFKFQFRQLETFIHPNFKGNTELPHISRFESTKMSMEGYRCLAEEVKKNGMLTMSTPFDEESVDVLCDMDLDIIKVGSCSAFDKPLLKKIARANKPVVISTAGLRLNQIDWIVSFFDSEGISFAIMHCVALYPTPKEKLLLNQITLLKQRYPDVPIGFSTHEDPNELMAIQFAEAKGAELFERHVGVETDDIKLNGYSSTPLQIQKWLVSYKQAKTMGGPTERVPSPAAEMDSLKSLKRGVYLNKTVKKGDKLSEEDVFFAMPCLGEQLSSGDWQNGFIAEQDYLQNTALSSGVLKLESSHEEIIYQIMLQVKGLLNSARISINQDSSIEISHHYGLERFREFGAIIIDCINRKYCKKLLIQLPRQKHPYHYHAKKEETFQLLAGDVEIVLEGRKIKLNPGDTCLVKPGEWHKFHTLDGAVIEEISTTHYNNDSFYEDPKISQLERTMRKTNVDNWLNYFRKQHDK
jgi:sialic acid synthase SpsE/mannose-6-phosphate isomerase-like protein (cupin superfamily)